MRSIGDRTHSPAKATASFADRGTRGSRRRRRAVVTHAGSTVAKSFADPGGNRFARTIITSHDKTSTMRPTSNHFNTPKIYRRRTRVYIADGLMHVFSRASSDEW